MFDQAKFWLSFLGIILALVVVFVAVDLLLLRKLPQRAKKRELATNILLGIGLAAILVLIIDTLSLPLFLQTLADKVMAICILALATTGIVLIFKTSITTNFAQGSMATVGAFTGAEVVLALTASTALPSMTKVILAILAGALVSFLIGLSIDVFVIRKAKYVTSIGKQMITMGLVLVFSGAMPVIFGVLPLEIPRLSYEITRFELFGAQLSITEHSLYALLITTVLLATLFSALRFTKWGLGVRATASNEIVAGMMGVNTRVITAMSWAIAGALGGTAAVLLAPLGGQVSVSLMTSTQVNGFMAAILGGFSTFGGPIAGTILSSLLTGLLTYFSFLWQNAIVYGIILLIVLVKPLGLFGKRIAKKV